MEIIAELGVEMHEINKQHKNLLRCAFFGILILAGIGVCGGVATVRAIAQAAKLSEGTITKVNGVDIRTICLGGYTYQIDEHRTLTLILSREGKPVKCQSN